MTTLNNREEKIEKLKDYILQNLVEKQARLERFKRETTSKRIVRAKIKTLIDTLKFIQTLI